MCPSSAAPHWLQITFNQAALPGGQRRRHKGNSKGQTSDGILADPCSSTEDLDSQSAPVYEHCRHLVGVNMSSLIIPVLFSLITFVVLVSVAESFFQNSPDTVNLQLSKETCFPLKTVCVKLGGWVWWLGSGKTKETHILTGAQQPTANLRLNYQ